jgi:hypothetical protein
MVHLRTLVVIAAMLLGQPAAAEDSPEAVSIEDPCPLPLGRYVYDSAHISYKVRVYLTGCPWYDGRPMLLRGSIVRSDGLGQGGATAAVRCQPGAPPPGDDPDDHTGHNSPIPQPPPVAQGSGEPQADEVRPADNCVLAVRMPHPLVESAHYEGELTYPVDGAEFTERISLDCISAHDLFYKCSPPGESPLAPDR